MAQRIQVLLTDDIDGTEAHETVQFGLDGVDYEIDLSSENAAQLRASIGQYTDRARKIVRSRSRGRSSRGGQDYDPKAVRAWAAANNVDLPSRGRIPVAVLDQYRAAGF